MPSCETKFVDVAGVRTRYFDKGNGPTLVLIHGGHLAKQIEQHFDPLIANKMLVKV